MIAARLRALRESRERGSALLVVIGVAVVMLILVATSLQLTSSTLVRSSTDQQAAQALDAAYAGVQEYQSRLNSNADYESFGNPASTWSAGSAVTLPTGASANPAFGLGTSGSWAAVPVPSGQATTEWFRYEVDNTQYAASGLVRLRATGRAGSTTRSVIATVHQRGFIDYLYFTDFETLDPAVSRVTSSCNAYLWATPSRSGACTNVQFGASDVLRGPVHSNDSISACGTDFKGTVTTSAPSGTLTVPSGCATPLYEGAGGAPAYEAPVTMPATNTSMKAGTYAGSTVGGSPGCLYTGPTTITFNPGGTMTVVSPWTKVTNPSYTSGVASSSPAMCGSISQLQSSGGATIATLPSNLVYVQNVPASTSDPNYSAAVPSNFTCTYSGAGWSYGGAAYPATIGGQTEAPADGWFIHDATTNTNSWTSTNPAYGCRNGDVFVKGTFKGAMTVAAENYVYVTGDLVYTSTTSDILGLVGNNAVIVWNPVTGSASSPQTMLTDSGRTVDAAILSVAHTFMVQNPGWGSVRGTLTVLGSIAQRYRGQIGAGTAQGVLAAGYAKSYTYDPRFAQTTPPRYLEPVKITYGVVRYATTSAAFNADGSAR